MGADAGYPFFGSLLIAPNRRVPPVPSLETLLSQERAGVLSFPLRFWSNGEGAAFATDPLSGTWPPETSRCPVGPAPSFFPCLGARVFFLDMRVCRSLSPGGILDGLTAQSLPFSAMDGNGFYVPLFPDDDRAPSFMAPQRDKRRFPFPFFRSIKGRLLFPLLFLRIFWVRWRPASSFPLSTWSRLRPSAAMPLCSRRNEILFPPSSKPPH